MISHPSHLRGPSKKKFLMSLSHVYGDSWRNNIRRISMTLSRLLPRCRSRNCRISLAMVSNLPSCISPLLPHFPDHEYFFIDHLVTTPQAGILQRDTKIRCLLCQKSYILGNMRAHVGQHILRHICGEAKAKALEVCFYALDTFQRSNVCTAWRRTVWFLWRRRLYHQA